MSSDASAFEFERKFIVVDRSVLPSTASHLIIQSYLASQAGYAVRVRLYLEGGSHSELSQLKDLESMWAAYVTSHNWSVVRASVGVKSPGVGGSRYEKEMEIDPTVAFELCRYNDRVVVKSRYSLVWGDDLWEIDVFHGNNRPLVLAECERTSPVYELSIPKFCGLEVTDNFAFANECLAVFPFGERSDCACVLAAQRRSKDC